LHVSRIRDLRSPAIAFKESPRTTIALRSERIARTQNRDSKALHLKLDELILAVEGARNRLVHLEELSDDELEQLHSQFKRIQSIAKTSASADG